VSLKIFAIAAIPAAAVYFVGLLSKNRSKTLMSAIAMVLLGLLTGSSAHIVTDLFFVAIAYLWTSENFTATEEKTNSTFSPPASSGVIRAITATGKKAKEVLVALMQATLAMTAFFVVLACALIWYNSTQRTADLAASKPSATGTATFQSANELLTNHDKSRAARTDLRERERYLDKRDCLTLLNNDEIARCSLTSR
jgi:hypothetical protein